MKNYYFTTVWHSTQIIVLYHTNVTYYISNSLVYVQQSIAWESTPDEIIFITHENGLQRTLSVFISK